MIRQYTPSVRPPETYELVPSLAGLLEASTEVQALVGDIGTVEQHAFGKPPSAAEPWVRVVVREPWIPLTPEVSTKLHWAPVEVVVQASSAKVEGWDPYLTTSAMHAAVYGALVGQKPTLQYATIMSGISRQSTPTRPIYDNQMDAYESAAVYRVLLGPIT